MTAIWTLVLFASCALARFASAQKPPNILLLMPDQWRWDWDGLEHPHVGKAPPIYLPHIERLRSLGTAFPRGGVVPSPVCAPSRASMASLREYDFAGVATNKANDYRAKENPTYFTALQRAGYHTMSTGKDDLTKATHLGYEIGHTRNGSNTYLAQELGFTESFRFEGKGSPHVRGPSHTNLFGYFLQNQTLRLPDGKGVNAFAAHRDCSSSQPKNMPNIYISSAPI